MVALIYIANFLLQYLLVVAFLLRVLLPLVRANMRNPVSQAVLRFTNPVVLPLRKVLPPIGRVDTASVVALLLAQMFTVALLAIMRYGMGVLDLSFLLKYTFFTLVISTVEFYRTAVFIYALMSWIAPPGYNPINDLLTSLCEPLIRPVRKLIPPIAGLDFSAVFVLVGLQALLLVLPQALIF